MKTLAVHTPHGWADVIAIVRDLRGFKVIVWQDRTGTIGVLMAELAEIRLDH